jgi:hypothetical protein
MSMNPVKAKLNLMAIAALLVCSDGAFAQDVQLTPTFGEMRLVAGEAPNLHLIDIVAGGRVEVAAIVGTDIAGNACRGAIANAPDYRLDYTAGDLPLVFSVKSRQDTTLVVNAPDGSWHCSDDGRGWPNPLVFFAEPESGQYDIWIGAYDGGNPEATLNILEIVSPHYATVTAAPIAALP